jgi:hypothetical protein
MSIQPSLRNCLSGDRRLMILKKLQQFMTNILSKNIVNIQGCSPMTGLRRSMVFRGVIRAQLVVELEED